MCGEVKGGVWWLVRLYPHLGRALVGVWKRWHGQAMGGHASLFAWGGLAVAVFPHPYMVAVALLLGKGLALLLQAKLLWGNFKGFSYSFLA